jgi:cell wall-associated NlpC family hydrolase
MCPRLSVLALALTLVVATAGGPPAEAAEPPRQGQIEGKRAELTQRAAVVAFARRQVGKPYVWGGTGPRSYDCSGLMLAAYRSVGRAIPRTTSALLAGLRPPRKLRRGDLVFGEPHHVAMYIGNGRVIHAPEPGRRVEIATAGWHRGYAARTVFTPRR